MCFGGWHALISAVHGLVRAYHATKSDVAVPAIRTKDHSVSDTDKIINGVPRTATQHARCFHLHEVIYHAIYIPKSERILRVLALLVEVVFKLTL